MALETLKGVEEIGGHVLFQDHIGSYAPIEHLGTSWNVFEDLSGWVNVDHSRNTIAFKIQNGPIKENGVNGCQVDTLIETAKIMVESLNAKFPCEENKACLRHLNLAIGWLEARRTDREYRGVEGYNKE